MIKKQRAMAMKGEKKIHKRERERGKEDKLYLLILVSSFFRAQI